MISVIMPSYLGAYNHAAADRDKKIVRAIDSVLAQTYQDWELMVVADGCEKTKEIVLKYTDPRIRGLYIYKKPLFSGIPRNTGIYYSKGDIICYLDIDDMFGEDHLRFIAEGIKDHDWVWFDDRSYNVKKQKKGFIPHPAFEDFHIHGINIHVRGQCGTSNIAHRKSMGAYWRDEGTYYHDYIFVNILKSLSKNYARIGEGQYLICHVPGLLDI